MEKSFGTVIFLTIAVIGVMACDKTARASTDSGENYPFFRDVREQAMGGAAVAVVDDQSALFLNPAGLGKIRGPSLNLIDPQLEVDNTANSALSTNNNYTGFASAQGLLGIGTQNPNQHIHAAAEVAPGFSTTNFAFAGIAQYDIDAQYSPSTGQFNLHYVNDDGAAIGYCFRLLSGRLKIGVMGKLINRVYINNPSIPGNSTNLTMGNLASEGDGVGWDAGMLLTAPWAWLPTLGVAAHDIGNTNFTLGNGIFYKPGPLPPPQYQSIDPAFAVFPILSNTVRSSFTVEWRDVQNPETLDPQRRLHVGAEIDFSDRLFLRGGMNERYYTAGIEFDLGHNQFQVATYGEEIGTYPIYQEDRRFMLMYSLRF